MEKITVDEVRRWSKGKPSPSLKTTSAFTGVSTDSRKVRPGDLFIALSGENFDGHDFVAGALASGAAAAVVREDFSGGGPVIRVKDTLAALGDIARGYRRRYRARVVAVTGSGGKTTTKEIIKKILAARYNVTGTEGNFNNQIGLPLSLLSLSSSTEFCVVEMGMNHKGEIDYLSRLAAPDAGIITNVGLAHLGFFRRSADIAECKAELLANLRGEKVSFLNRDARFFSLLKDRAPGPVVSFGTRSGADIRVRVMEDEGFDFTFAVSVFPGEVFRLNFWNPGWIYAGLAGIACAVRYGVPPERVKEALSEIAAGPGRGKVLHIGGITVIDESYNSNPDSLALGLYHLARKESGRKIAVIGDMAELGRFSSLCHRNIGRALRSRPVDLVFTLGRDSESIGGRHFRDMEELNEHLGRIVRRGDLILVKGSRIMRMERVVSYLSEHFGG